MAYDEDLADRLREALQHVDGLTERAMFGGLAFLVNGHMVLAASGSGGLLLRCDPEDRERHLLADGVGPVEMRGREMAGWLRVEAAAIESDEALAEWVRTGLGRVATLPAT